MKKLNPNLVSMVFVLLSLLIGGGLAARNGMVSVGSGLTDDSNPGNGSN